MKSWEEVKLEFLNDHIPNRLTFPDQTLRAFNQIESVLKDKFPKLLEGSNLFIELSKDDLKSLIAEVKGRRINRHDTIVIESLYKRFSQPK